MEANHGSFRGSLRLVAFLVTAVSCSVKDPRLVASLADDFAKSKIRRIAVLPITDGKGQSTGDLPDFMTQRLYDALFEKSPWQVVSPIEVRSTIKRLDDKDSSRYQWHARVGGLLFADSVLFGEIVRVRERVGSDYGAAEPASVHFVLAVLDVGRKTVIWHAEFQHTQKPLTESLFVIPDFLSKGVKWLTARELIEIGIEKATKNLIEEASQKQ
jgi:hypothetical protein